MSDDVAMRNLQIILGSRSCSGAIRWGCAQWFGLCRVRAGFSDRLPLGLLGAAVSSKPTVISPSVPDGDAIAFEHHAVVDCRREGVDG